MEVGSYQSRGEITAAGVEAQINLSYQVDQRIVTQSSEDQTSEK